MLTSFGMELSTAFANDSTESVQSFNDRLALVGDALALKSLGLCFRFGLLHFQNFFRLAARRRRHPLALRALISFIAALTLSSG